MKEAVELAVFLKNAHLRPEQVQDFYPTPGTVSTCMFYTGLDPYTMQSVYVAKDPHEKALQRALLQYFDPRKAGLVREALRRAGRQDLIGYGERCLVRPASDGSAQRGNRNETSKASRRGEKQSKKQPPGERNRRSAGRSNKKR